MLTKPAIVQEQRQSEFICSACGSARDCDCNAPALARLAAKKENERKASKAYRDRKKSASYDAPVEITDKFQPEPEASAEARKAHFRDQASPEQLDAMIAAAKKSQPVPEPVSVDVSVLEPEVERIVANVSVLEPPKVEVLGGKTIETMPPAVEVTGGIRVIEMPPYDLVRNGKPVSHVPATPADYKLVRTTRATHYLDVAQRSRDAAKWDLIGLKCTKEMLSAVDDVISAWTRLRRQLVDAGASYRKVSGDTDVAKV
jgi:hypothetical protein